jgi:hypothetical protein
MTENDKFKIKQPLADLRKIKAEEAVNKEQIEEYPSLGTAAFLRQPPAKRELIRIEKYTSDIAALNVEVNKLSGLESDKLHLLIVCLGCSLLSGLAVHFIKTGNLCIGYPMQIISTIFGSLVAIAVYFKSKIFK